MALQLLQFNPGIVKDITEYSAGKTGPFWVDGDLVRFRNGYPTKIGGWQKDKINLVDSAGTITSTETTITGIARAMVNWRAITDGEDRIAVGTHNHLYIIQDQSLYDITPLRNKSNNATTTAEALDASETEIDLVSGTDFKTAGTRLRAYNLHRQKLEPAYWLHKRNQQHLSCNSRQRSCCYSGIDKSYCN